MITIYFTFLSLSLCAQENKSDTIHKWYRPTHIQLQFAGNIGMFSGGASWSLLKENIEIICSMGFVPELAVEKKIYITSIKTIYTPPLSIRFNKNMLFKPLGIGFIASYTLGERYYKYEETNKYEEGYYWWKVPFRSALLYNLEFYNKTNLKHVKGFSFYFETSFWDMYLFSVFGNSNTSELNLWEATTFGLGGKLFF
jgi:hypothetical protein